mgnify:CR=1 FL=1
MWRGDNHLAKEAINVKVEGRRRVERPRDLGENCEEGIWRRNGVQLWVSDGPCPGQTQMETKRGCHAGLDGPSWWNEWMNEFYVANFTIHYWHSLRHSSCIKQLVPWWTYDTYIVVVFEVPMRDSWTGEIVSEEDKSRRCDWRKEQL